MLSPPHLSSSSLRRFVIHHVHFERSTHTLPASFVRRPSLSRCVIRPVRFERSIDAHLFGIPPSGHNRHTDLNNCKQEIKHRSNSWWYTRGSRHLGAFDGLVSSKETP